MRRFTSYFVAGLAVMLPTAATVYVLGIVFRVLSRIGSRFEGNLGVHIPGLGALATLAIVFLLGLVTTNVFGRKLVGLYHATLQRVPVIKPIYATVKQFVDVVASPSKSAFRRVVLVEWPSAGLWSVGYLVSECSLDGMASIFVPTSPNPATGFVVLTASERYRSVDMTLEEGMKFVVSCGAISAMPPGGEPTHSDRPEL